MTANIQQVFIFGYGYTSRYFTELLLKNNYKVIATSRQPKKITDIPKDKTFKLISFYDDNLKDILYASEAILISTPPDSYQHDPVLNNYKNLLDNHQNIKWLAYLSSTGVYGDHQGHWVNETSKCNATSQRALTRQKIEQDYLHLSQQNNTPAHVFRLAGIYGPDRNAITRIQAGKKSTIYKKDHFFSRIHVIDIANILFQSMLAPTAGEIYNLCDNYPAPGHEVDKFAAKLIDNTLLELIPHEHAELSSMAREFYSSNKKISNQKLKTMLGYEFMYPDYKAGLKACLTS